MLTEFGAEFLPAGMMSERLALAQRPHRHDLKMTNIAAMVTMDRPMPTSTRSSKAIQLYGEGLDIVEPLAGQDRR